MPMSPRALMVALLVGAAVGSCKASPPNEAKPEAPTPSAQAPADDDSAAGPARVVVYYFHATKRCPTCLGIQRAIEETLRQRYAQQLASGKLQFREINFETPEARPYVKRFNIGFSSMIVALQRGDAVVRWKNADKVWQVAHEPMELATYIDTQVREFVDEVPR